MEILVDSLQAELESLIRLAPRLGLAVIVLVVGVFVGKGARQSLRTVLRRAKANPAYFALFEGIAFWLCVLIAVGISLDLLGWDRAFAGFLAGGGIAAIILGFAFREIGENLLAGLMLAINRPFEVGDIIRSVDYEGVVKELTLRATHVRAIDGRDIFIPNAQIFTQPLVNYTIDGLRRLSFTLGIDYGDDPGAALELLLESTRNVSGVLDQPAPAAFVSALAPNYIELEVGFWVDTKEQNTLALPVRTEALKAARIALRDAGLTFSSDVTTNIQIQKNSAT